MSGPAPANRYDVMVVGEYYYDLIFTDLPTLPSLGTDIWAKSFDDLPGASYTTALALTRLGLKAGWWCGFGTDIFSRMVLDEVRREGIDEGLFQRHDGPLRRVSAAFSFQHDRGFISYVDEHDSDPTVEDVEAVQPLVLMLQGFARSPERLALINGARRAGVLVCGECQHLDFGIEAEGVVDVLQALDMFVPNETEAVQFTGTADAEAALEILARYVRTVVIKCGANGAIAIHDGRRHAVPAPKVEVVDTTGAGDSFNAGLIYGVLRGAPFEEALRYAVVCGSLSTTDYGGRALPREADLLAHVSQDGKEKHAR
ncbi:carbohydrate kinase family protein [Mesorhizobium sp. 1M-11]|uniref:carbohydrate kinase family protein n=1 Tax=Mesorhizobium sp. 1M-11 TaxID=1529006 RepID=UPI0006C73A9D|nr:carbohydrate kinase family protein [Mesorhizobium sp. 1M-11]